jgi:hypothetical protein
MMNIRRKQKADEGNSSSADHCNRRCCNPLLKRGAVVIFAVAAAATPAAYAVSPKPLTSSSLIGATGNVVDNSRFSPLRFLQGTEEVHDDHDHQHLDDHEDELHVEVRSLWRSSQMMCIIYPVINSYVSLSSFT